MKVELILVAEKVRNYLYIRREASEVFGHQPQGKVENNQRNDYGERLFQYHRARRKGTIRRTFTTK